MVKCTGSGCKTPADYGFIEENLRKFCGEHRPKGTINLRAKKCLTKGCGKMPSYNIYGKTPIFCKDHKSDDMVNTTKSLKCKFSGCTKKPSFGIAGKKAEYCKAHYDPITMESSNKKCLEKNCKKTALFGVLGGSRKWCFKHKKDGDINVTRKKCLEKDCDFFACYGFPKKPRIYCYAHKLDGMSSSSKKCEKENCCKNATYGFMEDCVLRFCNFHKPTNAINLRSKKCEHPGCTVCASFCLPGKKSPSHCKEHKSVIMILIKSRQCKENGCETLACYGLEKDGFLFCASHKPPGAIDLFTKRCEESDCDIMASYGFEDENKRRFCASHKPSNAVILNTKICKSEWCLVKVQNNTYRQGYCLRCFAYLYPDRPISRGLKTKERDVVKFIKEEFPDFDWVADKRIQDGCSLRRPDLLVDFGSHVLVVEIDENAHRSYETICENKRMVELFIDINHRPLVIIRFNPDGYIRKNDNGTETKIPSPWKPNKAGLASIVNKKDWSERLETLADAIEDWANATPKSIKRSIEVESLFFDGCAF